MSILQFWLQGHGYPPPRRPRIAMIIGNRISDARYWAWRIQGGEL